ncbi:cation:proton antiporter [Thermomonospora cellulosilytica]|uniref:Kef-type K+ transport system membrane component KefB n=1 Tax=Thermomonospora cellulosilytica TaxID=1411118 RepID=A0A7W3N3U7_9ACTN|nr:cation:proton antiporter [Thermomonospora cellulosilytica]MBA9007076.1 Kef-type K+ transport system membrane component KefB [Thermomonospora cellulosilytica]
MRVDILLLDIVVVLALARLLGMGARLIGQPPVIGEIVAGIVLGPTLLGDVIGQQLFPADLRPVLKGLADVGLVLFMFVVGMELDQKLVRGRGRVAASVSLSSTLLPFGLGCLVALWLAADHDQGRTLPFVLFFGAAMSATAFPVLARILTDRQMHRTRLGGLALACAAIIDVLAWTVLAVVVAIAGTGGSGQWQVALAVPFALVMFLGVRPLLRRMVPAYEKAGRLTPNLLALVLIGLFASAWATEWMHVHFIFGAFLFGAVMPREGAEKLNHEILERLEQLAVLLLLPMFFVVAGMSVDLTTLDLGGVGVLAVILAVAIGGKLGGAYVAARLQRVPGRQAAALAALINTRGLTEIVILSVGLEKGVLDTELYSLMVVMALVTTAMTGPLLSRVYPARQVERDLAEAQRAAAGPRVDRRVLVVVEDPDEVEGLAEIAREQAAGDGSREVVLVHLRPYPAERLEVGLGLSAELAEMAGTMAGLERLAAAIRTEELPVRVVSRFSADVAAELPGLVAGAEPHVIVIAPTAPGQAAVRRAAGRRVTLVDPAERRAVQPAGKDT